MSFKHIIVIIPFLYFNAVKAQSWLTVNINGIHFYLAEDYHNTLHRVSLLKTDTLAPGKIRYEFNKTPTVNPYRNDCFVKDKASWIGYQVIKTDDGIERYLNYASDTLVFYTKANLYDAWKIYQYPDSSYIRGTVDSISILAFMGITDSVKYIRLNLHGKNNSIINDPMNGVRVIISKNYGWIRTLAWVNFPQIKYIFTSGQVIEKYDFTKTYLLSGNTFIKKGLIPNFAEFVSDFEPGDEIHSRQIGWPVINFYEIKTIRTKNVSTDFETYVSHIMRRYPRNQNSDSLVSYMQTDTVYFTKNEFWPQVFHFSYLPRTKRLWLNGEGNKFVLNNTDSCYSEASLSSSNILTKYSIQGVGNFFSYTSLTMPNYGFEPVYFKKGNETWGTPLAFDSADFYSPADFRLINAGNQKVAYRQNTTQDSAALLQPFVPSKIADDSLKSTYVFPFYPSENTSGCISLQHASWLGRKVEIYKTGEVVFYNYKNEPITIKTLAALNEKWLAYQYPNGDYIMARVDIIYPIQQPNNGEENITKKISFHKFSYDSTEKSHVLNNISILANSKNGWPQLTEFNYFPFEGKYSSKAVNWLSTSISLFNLDDQISGFGEASLTHRKNYDLRSSTFENTLIKTLTSLHLGDTIIKKRSICKRIDDLSGNKISFTEQEATDSIPVVEYSYLSMQPILNNTLVKEICTVTYYTNDTFKTYYNTVRVKNIRYQQMTTDCWAEITEDTIVYEYYQPRLGKYQQTLANLTGKSIQRAWPQFGLLTDANFGKNEMMFCTQLDTFRFTQPLSNGRPERVSEIRMYPNPASEQFTVKLVNHDTFNLTLYNLFGQTVFETETNTGAVMIRTNQLARGVYLVRVHTDGSEVVKKIVLK